MGDLGSFGDWVRRRRKLLELSQADLAREVSCSLSMLRKIESDERRPSEQLAGLLADRLGIGAPQKASFLQLARGKFVLDIPDQESGSGAVIPLLSEYTITKEDLPPFVARKRQLQRCHEYLEGARLGQGKMVFIAGEAGQGKTSLLYEFVSQALDAHPDLIVAGGSSDVYTGQGEPLLPFKDIFRLLVGDLENAGMQEIINHRLIERLTQAIPTIIETLLDHGPHLIGTLLPEAVLEARLAHNYPHHPKSSQLLLRLQGQRDRKALSEYQELRQERLFDEISTTLKALAQRWPLILMLDDVHWIDHSSAALLGHLSRRLKHSPILVLCSYRPEELAHGGPAGQTGQAQHPLKEVLSESLRLFGQNRIDLNQSAPGEELDFVNTYLDIYKNAFHEPFRKQLTRLTEGHPLFVVELLRDMRERGDIFQGDDGRWQESESMNWQSFPARVEGVIEKRVAHLPPDLSDWLSVASVQGETFYAEIIARVSQSDPLELARKLSTELDRKYHLIQAQGVRHVGSERLSQYRFRHHLFQRYLYGRLSIAERMYLHESVGSALEAFWASRTDADDLPATQLARHFQEAHLGGKASRYLLLAGKQASQVLAFDEAAAHLERGIILLRDLAGAPEVQRLEYELSLALARALWHNGRVVEAVETYQKAIEIARALGDSDALAQAALAYEEPRWRLNLDPKPSQQFIREALAALGEEPSGLRVRLLVNLSRSLLNAGEQEELRTTVNQALHIARQTDDPLALYDVLRIQAQIDRRPETTGQRLSTVQELISLAESIGDHERLADALDLSIYDLLELGQIEQVDQLIETQRRIAQTIRQPFQLHVSAVFQTMRAVLSGEFETAERLANQAAEISQQIGIAELDGIFGIHLFTIRREQGRIREIAPLVKVIVDNSPESYAWRPGLALIYCILDQREACQSIFEGLMEDGLALIPQDSLWVATLAYLSEVCAYLGDSHRAATLYALLLPYDGHSVVVGGATACYGAVARYLGMLAMTISDWGAAERHFAAALALDARMQAWPWLAHSQSAYAAMLLARDNPPDRERASALLHEASLSGRQMGMVDLVQEISRLRARYELASG